MNIYRNIIKRLLIFAGAMLLISCTSIQNRMYKPQAGDPTIRAINSTMQQGLAENKRLAENAEKVNLPADVNNALLPKLSIDTDSSAKTADDQRFDVSVNEVPTNTFFMGLVKDTKYNMVISPKIRGTITLNLKNVTIPEVLAAVHDIYGYQYKRTIYGFEVSPSKLQTRVFTVNYLNMVRTGKSSTTISSGQLSQKIQSKGNAVSSTNTTELSSDVKTTTKSEFWKELDVTLKAMIGKSDGRKIVINPQSGTVIVEAFPEELNQVQQYLDSLQSIITRQVILDARILEVTLNDQYQGGVDWRVLGLSQIASVLTKPFEGLETFNSIFTLSAHKGSAFSVILKLISTQGNVQTLASPRIATLNNQKAVIKIGTDEFFITSVSGTTTASDTPVSTQNVEFTPFFSGIALDVTPEIDAHGDIILHIHPVISEVSEDLKQYKIGASTTTIDNTDEVPMAKTQIRESDNIVHAENGQIVVIGGLMKSETKEVRAEIPFLGKVPIIGSLFGRTMQESIKSELIILLRPIIVDDSSTMAQLKRSEIQYRKLNRGFHIGSHPEIFGNLGEPQVQKRLGGNYRAKRKTYNGKGWSK
jgi:MSHA biogenesis protein MshL